MVVRKHSIDIRIRRVNDNDDGEGFCDIWCDYLWDNEKQMRFECTLFEEKLEMVPEIPNVSRTRYCLECDILCGRLHKTTTEEEISLYDN